MTTRTWIAAPESNPLTGMNATPLIDVLLVLLIMFIMTVPIMTHAVKINMPGQATDETVRPPVVRVDIEYGGAVLVDGRELSLAQLERYFGAMGSKSNQPEIRIHANQRVKYERFAQVIAIAQRQGLHRIAVGGVSSDR